MPKVYVEYLDRPVQEGVTERQREKLRNAASQQLKKMDNWMNEKARRAMLCFRVNQRRVTSEEAYAQYKRAHENQI